jgi:hypothetical protein
MLPVASSMALAICAATAWGLTADYLSKPGAMILGLVLTIALTQLLWLAFSSGSIRLAGWGILAAVVVSFGYYGAYRLTDYILASSVSHQKVTSETRLGPTQTAHQATGSAGCLQQAQ